MRNGCPRFCRSDHGEIMDEKPQPIDENLLKNLGEINDLTADQLHGEPTRLAKQLEHLQDETERLAFANYKTFINAANCSRKIHDDMGRVSTHVDSVLTAVPSVRTECDSFTRHALTASRHRANNSHALAKHAQLHDLFEIATLMETCVRGQHWDEALQLSDYVNKLCRRLAHVPAIVQMQSTVAIHLDTMRDQLLQQLQSQATLTQCLKCVQHLRALNAYNDIDMRYVFLERRDTWLRATLLQALQSVTSDGNDAYERCIKLVETMRVHLFDICTQYKAVFTDDVYSTEESAGNPAAILHSWLLSKCDEFMEQLEAILAEGVGERLDSVLSHSMYFGASMGRLGADFRVLLYPIFERAALLQVERQIRPSETILLTIIGGERWVDAIKAPAEFDVANEWKITIKEDGTKTIGSAALALLHWPPLAEYTNALVTALNGLRSCCPFAVAPLVTTMLTDSITTVAQRLADLGGTKSDSHRYAVHLLLGHVCPFVTACVQSVITPQALLAALHLPSSKRTYVQSLLTIDMDHVREPLVKSGVIVKPVDVGVMGDPVVVKTDAVKTTEPPVVPLSTDDIAVVPETVHDTEGDGNSL